MVILQLPYLSDSSTSASLAGCDAHLATGNLTHVTYPTKAVVRPPSITTVETPTTAPFTHVSTPAAPTATRVSTLFHDSFWNFDESDSTLTNLSTTFGITSKDQIEYGSW